MKDLYLKRNELNKISQALKIIKFDIKLTKDQINDLIKKQDEVYKKYKFYENYLKIGGKINAEDIHSKGR